MRRRYRYVGPREIGELALDPSYRAQIRRGDDILRWISDTAQQVNSDRTITATFIIDLDERLWIADRHSEHVVCAGGQDVLAAGEITFQIQGRQISVAEITNQSTGYCPDPDSWNTVATALDRLAIPHPAAFTTIFTFRHCVACGTTNIVKDGWFECAVCQAPLSQDWNYPQIEQ